jgi:hypothetical protein
VNARWTLLLVALLAIAVAVVGCGGGDSSSAGTTSAGGGSGASEEQAGGSEGTTSADKAAYIRSASAVCKEAREGALERIQEYEKQHKSEGLSEVALGEKSIREVLLATIFAEIEGVRDLEQPAGDEEELEAIISEMETTYDEAKANKKLNYTEIEESFGGSDQKLKAYGLVDCAKRK